MQHYIINDRYTLQIGFEMIEQKYLYARLTPGVIEKFSTEYLELDLCLVYTSLLLSLLKLFNILFQVAMTP